MSKFSDLRVISGKFRGRSLQSPLSSNTHPMGAREKLALFNMVNVENAKILDAYAGSGALGIEALSRGAAEVIFVENNRKVANIIQNNLQILQADGQIFVEKIQNFTVKAEYQDYFDVIFADPPYGQVNIQELQNLVNLLKDDGVLALSSPVELGNINLPGLRLFSTHNYARAQISIYYK